MADSLLFLRGRFGRKRVLSQTRLGAYCLGVDEFVPIALVRTLDGGRDLDAIERETGIREQTARMCGLRAAVEPNSGRLHPWAEEAARGLYGALELEAVRE